MVRDFCLFVSSLITTTAQSLVPSCNEMQPPDSQTARANLMNFVHTLACSYPLMVHLISPRVQCNKVRKRSRNGADVPSCTIRHYLSATRLRRRVCAISQHSLYRSYSLQHLSLSLSLSLVERLTLYDLCVMHMCFFHDGRSCVQLSSSTITISTMPRCANTLSNCSRNRSATGWHGKKLLKASAVEEEKAIRVQAVGTAIENRIITVDKSLESAEEEEEKKKAPYDRFGILPGLWEICSISCTNTNIGELFSCCWEHSLRSRGDNSLWYEHAHTRTHMSSVVSTALTVRVCIYS